MPRPLEIYLDVETAWGGDLTVVGFYSSETGLVQLVGDDITTRRLRQELPSSGRLFTFNGHGFDLRKIKQHLRLDLHRRFDSWDLFPICRDCGLRGGLKRVERRAGYRRTTVGIDGWRAMQLWRDYEWGNERALKTLLRYNAEDVWALRAVKQYLAGRRLLERE